MITVLSTLSNSVNYITVKLFSHEAYEDRKPRERRSDHSINQDKLNKHLGILNIASSQS